MKKITISLFIGILILVSSPTTEADYIPEIPLLPSPVIIPVVASVKPKTVSLSDLIAYNATKYDVGEKTIKSIVDCESRGNSKAVHITSKERSYGLVQINLLAHPNISIAEAQDNEFAIDFLAKNLASGKGNMWSCFKSI